MKFFDKIIVSYWKEMKKMANVKISPSSLKGKVVLPASKSVAHRALICAALSGGTSEIKCDCTSRDINATVCALKALGAKIKIQKNVYTVSGIVPQRNLKIKNLCVMDVEKIYSFDYDIDVHILGDTSEFKKGEVS